MLRRNPSQGFFTYIHGSGENTVDSFSYLVTDSVGATSTATVMIAITPVNDAPTAIALSSTTVTEGQAAGAIVGALSTSDVDSSSFTYTILAGSANFAISGGGSGGSLVTNAVLSSASSPLPVTVRSTDGGGLFVNQAFMINVAVQPATDPTITVLDSQLTFPGKNTNTQSFTIGDPNEPPAGLNVSATVTTGTLSVISDITVSCTDADCTIVATAGGSGVIGETVTITVSPISPYPAVAPAVRL